MTENRRNKIIVVNMVGQVNRLITAFTVPYGEEYVKKFCDIVRHDWEKTVYGTGLPNPNPSVESWRVKFLYTPVMYKQAKYANIPYKEGTYTVVDAFACVGTRFYMDRLQVFVEVCKSDMGDRRIWANVYYVSDSVIPAIVIHAEEIEFIHDYPGDSKVEEA